MDEKQIVAIEDLFNKLDDKITDYLKLKDDIIDDDCLEAFEDSLTILKLIRSSFNLISKKRLAYFLKGLNMDNEPTFEQVNKLYNYIDSENKAEFISNSITKVLLSKSKKAAFLIGIILHRIINSKVDLTYKELICANALNDMYDFDIENIIILSDYEKYVSKKRSGKNNGWFSVYGYFRKWCRESRIDLDDSFILTVEKCIANQIFIRDVEIELDISENDLDFSSASNYETIKFSHAGKLLIDNLRYLNDL